MLLTGSLRVLDGRDRADVDAVLARDPLVNVFVSSRVGIGLESWRGGAEVWGWSVDGRVQALCYSGGNLVPAGAGPEALQAFADRARRQGRRCSSIVGPRPMVDALWRALEPSWGPARAVRGSQPFLAIDRPPAVAPDPRVRRVRPDEIDLLFPAAVAMFTEEVGVSPIVGDGATYRARVSNLVDTGRAWAVIDGGQVLFKAEVDSMSPAASQVQGVWVEPSLRGTGMAASCLAAVVRDALAELAPAVTLFVNDFNLPARRAYRTVGFTEVAEFASVLF